MAEVIGVVTGLMGGCDIVLRSSLAITKYISSVKNATNEMKNLEKELATLHAVVSAVKGFLQSPKAGHGGLSQQAPIALAIQQCKDFVIDLQFKFELDITRSRTRWALLSKENYQSALENLHRYISMFHLALSLEGFDIFFTASERAAMELTGLQNGIQRVIDIVEPLEGMKDDMKYWQKYQNTIEQALQLHNVSQNESLNHAKDISEIKETLRHVDETQKQQDIKVQDAEKAKEKQLLLAYISKVDTHQKHLDVVRTRHSGTTSWILEEPIFQRWLNAYHTKEGFQQEESTLWCHGMPGCGKTVMFSNIVNYLHGCHDGVASVYLSYQDPLRNDPNAIIRMLLRQAINSIEGDGVSRVLAKIKDIRARYKARDPPLGEILLIFKELHQLGQNFILCLDGIDEIPNLAGQILLRHLRSITMKNIRVLFMSRSNLSFVEWPHMELAVTAKENDLRIFLEDTIQEIHGETFVGFPHEKISSLKGQIASSIVKRSNGMFLLASLQLRQLESAATVREILELLDKIPETLDDHYRVYLDRIGSQPHGKLAIQALKWVLFSCRQLSTQELTEALSVRPNDSDRDPTGIASIAVITQATGGLLVTDPNSNVVRLVHETLQEFLCRHISDIFRNPHQSILSTLRTYLSFAGLKHNNRDSALQTWVDFGTVKKTYGLLEYSFLHWVNHASLVGPEAIALMRDIVKTISVSPFLLRLSCTSGLLRLPWMDASGFTPLHLSILWKQRNLVEDIVREQQKETLEIQSDMGLTALHIAAAVDDCHSARILLESGVTINVKDKQGRTPVHIATTCGNNAILRLILDFKDVDVGGLTNDPSLRGMFPIHTALVESHLACVQTLLERRADANVVSTSGQTPLHYAIQFCAEAIPHLIHYGASVSARSGNNRSSLHWACFSGVVPSDLREVLKDLDLSLQDNELMTPLHILAAVQGDHCDTASWLLKIGANPDLQDRDGCTPLHVALINSNLKVADTLLNGGASVDIPTTKGTLPFFIAIRMANCPRLLINRLAQCQQFINANTFLHEAVQRQNADEVYGILRFNDDNINAPNSDGETPLDIATRLYSDTRRHSTILQTRSDIVSQLLYHGADPLLPSKSGHTPLKLAVEKNSQPLLNLMLKFVSDWSETSPGVLRLLYHAVDGTEVPCFKTLVSAAITSNPRISSLLIERTIQSLTQDDITSRPSYPESTDGKVNFLPVFADGSPPAAEIKDVCNLGGCHKHSCTRLKLFCAKAVFLISFPTDHGPPPACISTFTRSFTDLVDKYGEEVFTSLLHGYGPDITAMSCREAINCVYSAIIHHKSIKKQLEPRQQYVPDYTWDDTLPLSSADLHIQSRGGSVGTVMKPCTYDSRVRSIAGYGMTQKQLWSYDTSRRRPSRR